MEKNVGIHKIEELVNPEIHELPEVYNKTFESKVSSALDCMDDFEALLKSVAKLDDDLLIGRLSAAVEEIMMNAITYGNLGIKKTGNHDFIAGDIETAENAPEALEKRVFVSVRMNEERVVITIQDQGKNSPEFWKLKRIDPTQEGLMNADGRGELITTGSGDLKGFDKPEYEKNEIGVKVTLRRRFK
jgi:anti-sigma regulatory factor (Ser/Thr protein kinase)